MTRQAPSLGLSLLVDEQRSEAAQWRRLREEGDAETRLALFDRYQKFACKIAREEWHRVASLGLDRADAEQVALEALLQAIDRFNPYQGSPFTAFARLRLRGAIHNALAKATDANALHSARRRIERDRLRSLKDHAEAKEPLELVRELALGIALGFMLDGDSSDVLAETGSTEPSAYDAIAWRQLIAELDGKIALLPERERMIIEYHYKRDVRFTEIASLLGVSKGRVSQLHGQAIKRLRQSLSKFS